MTNYFTTSPDWAEYALKNNIALAEKSDAMSLNNIVAPTLDIPAQRAAQAEDEGTWTADHPLSSVDYQSRDIKVPVRDGVEVSVKISWPITKTGTGKTTTPLPVIFVTHGGGWIQGTHITEERWLLWPLFQRFKFIVISVEYRLAPEHPFPTWMNDSWDVLQVVLKDPASFAADADVNLDLDKVVLAGSSAGAGISALMAQTCRDQGINIRGVVLNAPVLCDYRHLPREEIRQHVNEVLSYEQCTGAALNSGEMKAVWDLVIPSNSEGSNPKASPLLGNCKQLPTHLIFAAGQDPLCDEARYYAHKLSQANVSTSLTIYPGVPHAFAEIHHLPTTQRFWGDFQTGFEKLIA